MSWFSSLFSSRPETTATPSPSHEKRLLEVEPPAPVTSTSPTPQSDLVERHSYDQPNRNRNKVIFGAGAAFFAFSLLITRRSFARKRIAANPAFYTNTPAHHVQQAARVSGVMEALEALNIATINVLSVTMMATGGALWYLDINSMKDARRLLRGGLGVDETGREEQRQEEEFEEWMATVLGRRDAKEKNRDDASETRRTNERGKE